MINDKDIAKEVNNLMLEYQSKLSESVAIVRDNCNEKEVYDYRKAVGNILGNMITQVMNPIYKEHPDLKPENRARSYFIELIEKIKIRSVSNITRYRHDINRAFFTN